MRKVPLCRNTRLLVVFLLFCHCCCHTSFLNDVAAWRTRHNGQFGVEAASPTAPMPTSMLIVTSLEGYCRSPGTKPYVFLRRSQPTTNPQPPSTWRDLNGWQQPPWCPTPVLTQTTVAQNVGGFLYVATQGVGHHGGCGKMAANTVGRARFN